MHFAGFRTFDLGSQLFLLCSREGRARRKGAHAGAAVCPGSGWGARHCFLRGRQRVRILLVQVLRSGLRPKEFRVHFSSTLRATQEKLKNCIALC